MARDLGESTLVLVDQKAVLVDSARCGMSKATLVGRRRPVLATSTRKSSHNANSGPVAGFGGSRGRSRPGSE